jgi:hypothetical protein
MKDKTTETLFTKEFLDNLEFLIENWDVVESYEQSIKLIYYYDPLHGTKCDRELEQLAEKYEDLVPELERQISDHFNINFKHLEEFTHHYRNMNLEYVDLEAELIEYLQDY